MMTPPPFLGHNNNNNKIKKKNMLLFFVCIMLFEITPAAATGKLDLSSSSSSRDELVNWAGYGEDKLSTVVINGKLLCHDQNQNGSIHPQPISGASVGVLCGKKLKLGKTKKKKKSWAWAWAAELGITDSYGEFLIDIPSHLHAIPNLDKICFVKLVHLPTTSPCHINYNKIKNKNKNKAAIIKLTSIGEGIRTYTAQNIHLSSS